jgi:hypothetical protein
VGIAGKGQYCGGIADSANLFLEELRDEEDDLGEKDERGFARRTWPRERRGWLEAVEPWSIR